MERKYALFSDYIYSCMKDMGKEFEQLRQKNKRDEKSLSDAKTMEVSKKIVG